MEKYSQEGEGRVKGKLWNASTLGWKVSTHFEDPSLVEGKLLL